MELKIARQEIGSKPKLTTIEKIEAEVKKEGQKIFYFDKDNSHKDLVSLVDHFENEGYSVYLKDIKYGLDENSFMYEVHIL